MLILHGFWRSLATYRVRAGLLLKGVAFEERMHDLDRGDQHSPAFRAVNPASAVPVLEGGTAEPLTQSLAILEWLEETHPAPPLLPPDPAGRARVRALFLLTAADTHPVVVPRVQARLAAQFGADEAARRTGLHTGSPRALPPTRRRSPPAPRAAMATHSPSPISRWPAISPAPTQGASPARQRNEQHLSPAHDCVLRLLVPSAIG